MGLDVFDPEGDSRVPRLFWKSQSFTEVLPNIERLEFHVNKQYIPGGQSVAK